jgi:hypothetical protein
MKTQYIVYKIVVDGIIRYIGRTNNLNRRYNEHKKLIAKGKSKPLYDYAKSIDEVEKETGIDFFFQFNDEFEENLESKICIPCWEW